MFSYFMGSASLYINVQSFGLSAKIDFLIKFPNLPPWFSPCAPPGPFQCCC